MHRVHDGTSQARALPRAKRFNLFQWGNKRKKMQKNNQMKCMLKMLAKVCTVKKKLMD